MAEQKQIQIQAILENVSTLKDRTIKLVFYTQEVTPSDAAALMGMAHEFGYLLFAPHLIRDVSLPALPDVAPTPPGKKTQSQRLRNSFYRLWESRGISDDFEDYYKKRMEHLILWVQTQIEPGESRDNDSQG